MKTVALILGLVLSCAAAEAPRWQLVPATVDIVRGAATIPVRTVLKLDTQTGTTWALVTVLESGTNYLQFWQEIGTGLPASFLSLTNIQPTTSK
jgi:hypothetical protein